MIPRHPPGSWYVAPATDPTNEYAAGYDVNVFSTEQDALDLIPELIRCMRPYWAPDDPRDDTEWIVRQRPGRRTKTERWRCPKHPRRWVIGRWSWRDGETIEDADGSIVHGCAECDSEDEEAQP